MGCRPTSVVLVVLSAWLAACGAADNRVDPGDLAMRDLLGLAPHVAIAWDEGQRAAARHVVGEALGEANAGEAAWRPLASGRSRTERIARTLAVADGDRAGAGFGPVPLVSVVIAGVEVATAARAAATAAPLTASDGDAAATPMVELWLSPAWDDEPGWGHLPGRGLDVLSAFARDAGHRDGPVVVVPAPRLAVAAAYVAAAAGTPAEVLVNPVVLAALEPDALEAATAAGMTRSPLGDGAGGSGGGDPTAAARRAAGDGDTRAAPVSVDGTGGNPYSFYGSVAECAYVQRTRCEACLAASDCTPVTDTTDGLAECTQLAADGGRGYFLLCINLSLAIASVDACVADEVPACVRDTDAASKLAELANNASFLDDPGCATGLDACLADIYGAPPAPFPGPDGGTVPTEPPRTTNVSCGDACDSDTNNGNVECSPSCGGGSGSGPSCNNAFSCDSACSSSNEQSGCGGNCEACESSSDTGGSTEAGCGGCDSEPASGGGDSCGSCDDSSSSGGGDSCGSCDDSSSSGGGSGCGGGGCDSSSSDSGGCGSGGGGGGCGGGGGSGGSGSCNVQRRGPPASVTLVIALLWGLLPLPAAALVRRRARRKAKAAPATLEVTP